MAFDRVSNETTEQPSKPKQPIKQNPQGVHVPKITDEFRTNKTKTPQRKEQTVAHQTPKNAEVDKAELIKTINLYNKRFPSYVPKGFRITSKTSIEELNNHISDIKLNIQEEKAYKNLLHFDNIANLMIERVGVQYLHQPLQGYYYHSQQNRELIKDELQMLAIEYRNSLTVGPLTAYFIHTAKNISEVIEMNDPSQNSIPFQGRDETSERGDDSISSKKTPSKIDVLKKKYENL